MINIKSILFLVFMFYIIDAKKKKRCTTTPKCDTTTTSEKCNSHTSTTSTTFFLETSTTIFPETSTTTFPKTLSPETDFEIKSFNSLINNEKYPSLIGSIHTLSCPIKNKDLINELLCGLDPKYSTDKIILYSGFIYNSSIPAIYINCVDIVVHNMLENVDTKYFWHGKCFFTPFPSASEVYKNQTISLERESQYSKYQIKSQEKLLYEAILPPLNDPVYKDVYIPDNVTYSTEHIHLFSKFYSTYEESFCYNNLSTALMTINFGKIEKVKSLNLKNLNNITITEEFGKYAGLKHFKGKEDLDEENCHAAYILDAKLMDTDRAVYVDKNTAVPVKPTDISLSKMSQFPFPFDKMNNDVINKMKMKNSPNKYSLNAQIMELMEYNKNN